MDEIRKKQNAKIVLKDKTLLNALVCDYQKDRVLFLILPDSISNAKKIKELDDLLITVHTHMGIKSMFSSTISALDKRNCIVTENNPSVPVEQKREFARVSSDFNFIITKDSKEFKCKSINISAGGIAFHKKGCGFEIGDDVRIKFNAEIFDKEIECDAKIIKNNQDSYVAKYENLNKHDADKIVKHVFNLMAKK